MRSSTRLTIAAVAGAALLLPVRAEAQTRCTSTGTIEGVALSDAGAPIPGVELAAAGLFRVVTDTAGRFHVASVCAGPAVLTARRIGFAPGSWAIVVRRNEILRLDINLNTVAQGLEPVVVRARETPSQRRLREFYHRRERTAGHFLTREQLAAFDERQVTDVLRSRVPGVRIISGRGLIRNQVRLRNNTCAPLVWIDGMPTPAGEFDIDALQTAGIAGIEVYSGPATIPAEFRLPYGRDGCGGVIVVWSRIGRDQWDRPRRAPAKLAGDAASATLPVFDADEVDVAVAVDSSRLVAPVYPDSLLAFQVHGEVVAEFVVDTSGAPMPSTIRIVSTSGPLFSDAVVEAIERSRFVPARKGERVVRQRVVLPYRFTFSPDP